MEAATAPVESHVIKPAPRRPRLGLREVWKNRELLSFFAWFFETYTGGRPYALLALSGSVIWLFFANSVTLAAGSLVGNASLLTKVYFPRLLAPLAPIVAALVDLVLATLVLLAVMAGYGEFPAPQRVWT